MLSLRLRQICNRFLTHRSAATSNHVSKRRLCRLEPLEDRRLLSVTNFQPPEPLLYGPSLEPVTSELLLPVDSKTTFSNWTAPVVSSSKEVLLQDLATTTTTADGVTNYYAVIVGIGDYPDMINDLNYPANDAQEMRDTLLTGINWRPENITLLTDSNATTDAIISAIQDMASTVDADDTCLFYYAGHGIQDTDLAPLDESDGLDEILVTYDFLTSGGLSDDLLSSTLSELPTDQLFVAIDCCQAPGTTAATATTEVTIADGIADNLFADQTIGLIPRSYNPNQGVAITACAEGERSSESDAIEHAVFTYNLLESLKGWGDANDDGWVSAEEMFTFAEYNAVIEDPMAQPTIFDQYTGELPILQLASEMPEVIYYENFAVMSTDWGTVDGNGDGTTWTWFGDETMYEMVYYPTTTVYPVDGMGSPSVDCSGYDNLFFKMNHSVTSYNADLLLEVELVDSVMQRTKIWNETVNNEYDLGAVVLDISDVAANDPGLNMEWWLSGEIPTGAAAIWELIDVELRGSDTKDIRVSVLDQGTENSTTARARVDILAALSTDLTITLNSGDTDEVVTPEFVTILAGETTAEFNLTILDDARYDGTQTVSITASATGYQAGSDTIDILDNEPLRLAGDANLDGRVDGSDVTILAGNWQSTTATWGSGDFNGDGRVDGSDVTILAGNWQAGLA